MAQENTRKNRYGQTTISRADDDFYDDVWDEAYRKSQQSMNKWYERKEDSGKGRLT